MLFILIVVMISWVQREKFCKNPGREVAKALYEMERNMDNLKIMQPVVGSIFLSRLVESWNSGKKLDLILRLEFCSTVMVIISKSFPFSRAQCR